MARKIEISHRTIVFTVLFLALIWVLVQIKAIIIGLFVSVLLVTALSPLVDRLTKLRIPRSLAILLVYIGMIALIIAGLASLVTPLFEQTSNLVARLPQIFDDVGMWLASMGVAGVDGRMIAGQVSQLGQLPANLIGVLVLFFSNLVIVVSVLIITFYMLLEKKNLNKYLSVAFGNEKELKANDFAGKIEMRLGGWVRGELVLMLIVGVLTYIGLTLLGVPSALPLAILAGLLEIVPTIGPIFSGIPAVIVGFTISPFTGFAVMALYFLVQQLENSLIVPKVMQKAVGVNPLVTIISLGIGYQLGGPLGAILAVPIVIVARVVAVELFDLKGLAGK